MESPGEYLKRERELRGIAVDKVCAALKISAKTLKSIECDNYGALPHEAYVRGFIKSYSRFLGVDEHDAALRFDAYLREKAESAEEKKKKEERLNAGAMQEKPRIEARREWKFPDTMTVAPILVLLGVVLLAAYVVIFGTGRKDTEKTVSVVPPPQTAVVPQEAATSADVKALPQETKKKPEFNVLAAKTEPQKTAPVKTEPVSAEPAKASPPKVESAKPAATEAAPTKTAVAPVLQPAGGAANVLVITAKEDVWVKVEADSKEPFEMLMREGDKRKVEATVFF